MNKCRALLLMCLLAACPAHAAKPAPKYKPHRPMWRGIVEGFYGAPWSQADRISTLRWMSARGMNLYIYAPKDDPYHREKWREPYPAAQMARFTELARAGKKAGITVMVAISPGPSMHYSSAADLRALFAKIDALAAAGVPRFAIFLDDIPDQMQYEDDRAAYPDLGAAHVDLLNRVFSHLRAKRREKPFLTVGPEYWNLTDTPYKRAMKERLDRGVTVMWTGTDVLTKSLTPEMVAQFRALYGRAPFLWDNLPVNDYARGRLFMGPVMRRGDVGSLLSGYVMNPMSQAIASRITLFTGADYSRDTARYAPWASWVRARRNVFGPDMPTRAALGAVAELNTENALYPGNGPLLSALLGRYKPPTHGRVETPDLWRLEDFFGVCTKASATLDRWSAKNARRANPHTRDLLRLIDEVRPWLPSVEKAGEAGLLALKLDADPTPALYAQMMDAWTAANKGPHVAGSALSGFIEGVAARYREKQSSH